ncbi:MAG: hypothetical protein WC044_10600 [Crocinitomicaceae bacterium]
MITLLVGINILVFSTSFYGNLSTAVGQAIAAMAIVGLILVGYGFLINLRKSKKSAQVASTSKEN